MRNYIKFPVFLVTFQSRNYKQRLKGFYWKSLKIHKAYIKEKIDPSNNTFSKLLSKKIHFQNYCQKKFFSRYFFKIALLENTLSNKVILSKKYFQSYSLKKIRFKKNYSFKKYIFKFTFSKVLSQKTLT